MSATVIDSLLVELKLDKKSYDTGYLAAMKEQQKFTDETVKNNKKLVESNKSVEQSLHRMKLELLAAAAVFFGATGFKEWIADMVTGQAALGRLSTNLGISAQRLDAWGTVAEEMGDRASDALGALQTVAAGVAEATIKGHSALTDVARANGVSLTDARGQLVSSEEILIRFAARMQQLPRQQAIALANMAGLGGVANELLLGPDELTKRLAAAQQLSRATEESTKQAQELEKRWALLMRRFHGVQEEIFARLSPTFERLFDRFTKWLDTVNFDKVINQVERFVTWVNKAVEAVGGWKVVAEALGVVLALKVLSPLTGLVGLIARLAGLGGASAVVSTLASSFQALGLAAAGVSLAAVAGVAGAAALVYSPATGGKTKDGEQVEDLNQESRQAAKALGGSDAPKANPNGNAELWKAVRGEPSAYAGTRSQAALLLAERSYADPMSAEAYRATAREILSGRLPADQIAYGARPEPNPVPTQGPNPSEAALARGEASPRGSQGDYAAYFAQLEGQYGLPAGLLDRVWAKESARSTGAIASPKGAQGPFQFTPETAQDFGLTGDTVNQVEPAAAAAAKYLAGLRAQFGGDLTTALAAYNWGPGNVARKGLGQAPDETRDYMHLADGLALGPPQRYGAGFAPSAAPAAGDVSNETHIGEIKVYSQATDARGIVKDMRGELRNQGLVYQSNQGVE